jgi:very-short-patch-repair endonuclease
MARRGMTLPLDRQCQLAGLPMPTPEYRFHPTRRWRFDLAWPDKSIAVEVDGAVYTGGRHTRGKGFENDMEKVNAAVLAGWAVLRFSTGMVRDGRALGVIEQLLKAV